MCYNTFMTQFFTSDLHLGHARILELGSGRPFANIGEHNMKIVNNWNNVVSPEDTVFLLGDIVMGEFEKNIELIRLLNGEKFLVAGNHDRIFSGTNSKPRIERHIPLYEAVGLTILPENSQALRLRPVGEFRRFCFLTSLTLATATVRKTVSLATVL